MDRQFKKCRKIIIFNAKGFTHNDYPIEAYQHKRLLQGGLAPFGQGKAVGRLEPGKKLGVDLVRGVDEDMVGPTAGIGLHRHGDPGGVHPGGQAQGQDDAMGRPALSPADGQGHGGEQVSLVKADLGLLHLDLGLGEGRVHGPV